ncbi:nonsense-mediated mRNA decay protein-like protein [Calycina marina]|uniref:Nonsense-mediated mRNA decay protein-like protein n=1 Tax=Calycina marina TaxID=1763456 RepID=A0A9P8CHD1_9HELO|nr:nonsense-mediated mRNA decay protein-like protein [Calycina marina]
MDVVALRGRIIATLDADTDTRRRAELDLKTAEEHSGFTDALLDILQNEQEDQVRISTVLYLKNRVTRAWHPSVDSAITPISDDEKARFRARLLPVLAASQPRVRHQLVPILQKILHHDFPEKWPGFIEITVQLLNTNDASSIFAGLQCLLAICRVYRFKSGEIRNDFDKIVEATFPRLLAIGQGLVAEMSEDAGEMLHVVLKAYKHATFFDLATSLRDQTVMVGWCTLFLQTVAKDVPQTALPDDLTEREANHWWKSKKWAYFNMNRLFVRYGNPSSLQKGNGEDYTEFAKSFIINFAPEILKGYLQQIEKWVAKTTWLSRPCLSFTLVFLDECIKPKEMWAHLKDHLDSLVTHFIFPVMCLSEDDVEKFSTDPEEYLHGKLNYYEEVGSPDIAATNFLVTLTKVRRKNTFTILAFVNTIVNEYETAEDGKKNHIAKEGALRMIGTLSSVILGKKSPIAEQVEYFLVRYVFPDFHSPQGFLRARACDTVEKFEQLEFKDSNNLLVIYRNILECMADPELPVRVEAALALQPLIRHDIIRTNMQQNIPQIMQQLLKLANEVDVDSLSNVMEDFVEVFAAELTPFAVALSEQLRDTYLRIIRDLLEKNKERDDGADEPYGDYLDDKSITALGVLQTIGTLILTLESTPDVLLHMEAILMPVVKVTLENKLYDLYNEVFEIIDSCTFAAKSISPHMWQAFELIHSTFKAGAELYLEDMLPALDNFVQYGAQELVAQPRYLDAMYSMVHDMFNDGDKIGGMDKICACKLAEGMMLSIPRPHLNQHVGNFIGFAMRTLLDKDTKVKSFRIHLMEMVINAIYYDPALSLQVLEQNNWTNTFFSTWFSNIDNFTRVHDKKLSISAIVALLALNPEQVPISVQQGWPRLLQGIVRLFQTLPAAAKNREEALKDDYPLDGSDYGGDDDNEEWGGDDSAWTEDAETEDEIVDGRDESSAYLEFLTEEAQKFKNLEDDEIEDDDLGEESLLETPLDKVEPYQLFSGALRKLQLEQPALYASLTGGLGPEEQAVLQSVVNESQRLAILAAQQQAEAVAAGL